MTESKVTAYLFDHLGAVSSVNLFYLEVVEEFLALILGLASAESALGLDPNIWKCPDKGVIISASGQRKL